MPEYATIQQHQPLRVPASFDRQGKALVLQLDEVFDDIYRRFGRLRLADMGKEFRKQIADDEGNIADLQFDLTGLTARVETAEGNIGSLQVTATALTGRMGTAEGNIGTLQLTATALAGRIETAEGNITNITADVSGLTTRVSTAEGDIGALEVRAGNIEIAVSNKYSIVSGITIDSNGIELTGSKYVKIKSGCTLEIATGGTLTIQSGNFVIDSLGNVTFAGALNGATGTFTGKITTTDIEIGPIETLDENKRCGVYAGYITFGDQVDDTTYNVLTGVMLNRIYIPQVDEYYEMYFRATVEEVTVGQTQRVAHYYPCFYIDGPTNDVPDLGKTYHPFRRIYISEIHVSDGVNPGGRLYIEGSPYVHGDITTIDATINGDLYVNYGDVYIDAGELNVGKTRCQYNNNRFEMIPNSDYAVDYITIKRTVVSNNHIITIDKSSSVNTLQFAGNADTATRLSKRPTYGELSGRS